MQVVVVAWACGGRVRLLLLLGLRLRLSLLRLLRVVWWCRRRRINSRALLKGWRRCVGACRRHTLMLLLVVAVRGGVPIFLGISGCMFFVRVAFKIPLDFGVGPAPHAYITADAHSAALLGHESAERGALCETRKLLGAVDGKWRRLDFEAEVDVGRAADGAVVAHCHGAFWIHVLCILELFVEVEAQTELALVAHRQVGEDKVAGLGRAVEVGHASDRHAREHGVRRGHSAGTACSGNRPCGLERCVEEEAGVVLEGDVLAVRLAFEDFEFDDRGRIDGAAVCRGCGSQQESNQ